MTTLASPRARLTLLLPLLGFLALLALVVVDGPTTLRLSLAVIGITIAVGTPIVGLLDLPRSPTRSLLVVGTSLSVAVLLSEVLVLVGRLTPTAAAAGLVAVSAPFTVAWARSSWRADPDASGAATRVLRDLRTAPRPPAALTVLAAALWLLAAMSVDPRDAGEAGMISALPITWWLGIASLMGAFFTTVRGRLNPSLAFIQVGMLIAFLYVTMTISEPYSRIPTSYTHVGLVDYIVRDSRIVSSFDARYSWPGSLSLGAMLSQLGGVESSAALVRWALPSFVVAWALAVYAMASVFVGSRVQPWVHPRRRPAAWITVWVFLMINWVGQDYWSSQALNFFLVIVVIAAVLTWFPRRERGPRTPPFLPDENPPPLTSRQRGGLFLVIVLIATAVASSHQLSPFMLTGALTMLWLVDRRDIRFLPMIAGVVTLIWLSWGAQPYWVSHLGRLTEDVGEVGQVITSGTSARIAEASFGRQLVLATRLGLSAIAWIAAAMCFVAARRKSRQMITAAALGLVPFGAVAMQEYGGELGLRIFLFSMPFIALLVAQVAAGTLTGPTRRPALVVSGAAVAGVMLVATFVVARYGNEQFEQIYAEDVAAVQEFYRIAPKDARLIANNTSNPFRMGPYHDYRPAKFDELAHPEETDIEASLRRAGFDQGYILVTEAGIKEALLREGAQPGWELVLDDRLETLGAQERFRDGRAALYELSLEGVEPVAADDPPARSLASRWVRSVLGVPALAGAVALALFLILAGLRQVAGLRRQSTWTFAAAWAGAFGLVAIVAARFIALT